MNEKAGHEKMKETILHKFPKVKVKPNDVIKKTYHIIRMEKLIKYE